MSGKEKLRFHLLGVPHIPTTREYSVCAYTQKVIKLAAMLKDLGHEVHFYGGEGSDVPCDTFTEVVSDATRKRVYGDYDWRTEFFKADPNDEVHREFNKRTIQALQKTFLHKDFLLCSMGSHQKKIAESIGERGIVIEPGIGYSGVFSKYRVFESYAWMHYLYGENRQDDGSWYDAVIPNYFDPNDFEFSDTKDDYYLFVGRLIYRKGLDVAVEVTKQLGKKLIVAGQGSLINPNERLNITDPHVEHIGSVGPEERSKLMGRARAVFAPTYYIEPFGGVAVEAQMCGTPVITSDFGAFTETVLHGVTGYRCRTLDDFVFASENVDKLSYSTIRQWAVNNYSMDRIKLMYDEYFHKVYDIWKKGWYELNGEREELDWLVKYLPTS